MHEKCLFCGLGFEREQGYFVGAMYISYGVAIPFYLGFYFLLRHYLHQSVLITVAFATLMFLPFVPLVFRASRILWIYFDRAVDPESHL